MTTNQQREELHRTIWAIANDLRGAIDGWEFKAYVLGTLFYRFISENLTDYINRLQAEAGVEEFDYACAGFLFHEKISNRSHLGWSHINK